MFAGPPAGGGCGAAWRLLVDSSRSTGMGTTPLEDGKRVADLTTFFEPPRLSLRFRRPNSFAAVPEVASGPRGRVSLGRGRFAMKRRHFRYPYRKRSYGWLWLLLGL